jgi:hypothetical protein
MTYRRLDNLAGRVKIVRAIHCIPDRSSIRFSPSFHAFAGLSPGVASGRSRPVCQMRCVNALLHSGKDNNENSEHESVSASPKSFHRAIVQKRGGPQTGAFQNRNVSFEAGRGWRSGRVKVVLDASLLTAPHDIELTCEMLCFITIYLQKARRSCDA